MKFIVLGGKGKSGKTTVLNKLALDLLKVEYIKYIGESIKEIDNQEPKKTFVKSDKIYKFKYQDKMILIITAGDVAEKLVKLLNEHLKDVDIVFCPIRAYNENKFKAGKYNKILKNFIDEKGSSELEFKEQNDKNDKAKQEEADKEMVKKLKEKLD